MSYVKQLSASERIALNRAPAHLRESIARRLVAKRSKSRALLQIQSAMRQLSQKQAGMLRSAMSKSLQRAPEPVEYDEAEEYTDEVSGETKRIGRARASLVKHDGRYFVAARFPFWIVNGPNADYSGDPRWCCLLIELTPETGVEVSGLGDDLKAWWERTKPRIRQAIANAMRSPYALLAAGISFAMGGWGIVFASVYLGARAGLAFGQRLGPEDRVATDADRQRTLQNQLHTTIVPGKVKS